MPYATFRTIFVSLLILAVQAATAQKPDELDVIRKKWMEFSDYSDKLYHHLSAEAFRLLDRESFLLKRVTTRQQWVARQEQKRKDMWVSLGPFASKTPLNPRITGVIQKDGFRVENVIYESLPGYFVTASLFIPDNVSTPAPAILFCSGHSQQAFRRDLYQLPLLNLVRKGFIVLAFDPVGQGERMQYMDPKTRESLIGSSTREHSYPSLQAFLLGQSVARYFVWDGIRSMDYLVSRPEVDPTRIGVHGLSGGGTQSAYIGALDDRVAAVAPAGYITGHRRLLESIGPQDGEQSFYHGLVKGLDHADLLEMRAPKPTLIMATTRDFFNIEGTRETFERVQKAYRIFGKPNHIALTEGDFEHGYTQNIRERMYAFFQEHLRLPGSAAEEEVKYLTEQELQKTATGQLSDSEGGESLFSLNRAEAVQLGRNVAGKRKANPAFYTLEAVKKARVISGFRAPSESGRPVFSGRILRDGYVIEKYFILGEGNYPVPYALFRPEKPNGKALIYLHPSGKSAGAEKGGEIEWLLKKGMTVLAPDLIGIGEMAPDCNKGSSVIDGVSYSMWFSSVLTSRSIVGIQASDLLKLKDVLKKEAGISGVYALAHEQMSPVLLHAAAFDNTFAGIVIRKPFVSYRSVVMSRFYKPSYLFGMVAGSLSAYDLPDLAASLAPTKLWVSEVTNGNGDPASEGDLEEMSGVFEMYRARNASANYHLSKAASDEVRWKSDLEKFLD